jgi:diguanylate cyclase (GGDEF)-like protein/PAS domain S-box-containing protein
VNSIEVSGYPATAVAGRTCGDFLMHCDDHGNVLCGAHCPVRESAVRRCPVEGRVWLKHADGARIPVNVSANPVMDSSGQCVGIVEIFRDVSEELALLTRAQELESQALIDPLTGLGNRRYAERVLEQSWEAWQRYGTHFGVAMFDIDHFKSINDRHGHPAGDEVLRGVAITMAGNLRIFDFLGRWGGEEFLAIVQSVATEDLVPVARRCRELGGSIRVPAGAEHIAATLSAGVASAGECRSVAELVGLADRRLYRAKSTGRNRLVARSLPASPAEKPAEAVA